MWKLSFKKIHCITCPTEATKNYLISLNNDLLNISKKDLNKLATQSMVREKIKKIEILKYIELDNNSEIVNNIIKEAKCRSSW